MTVPLPPPYTLRCDDVLSALHKYPDNHFDALFSDPPYALHFMGKAWDYELPGVDVWKEALRVLKPGAHILVFGGARTYHRLTCNVENAGFDVRDCLMYLYGKGFPKSLNVSLAIDKQAGATRDVVGTRTLTGNAAISTKEKGGTYGVQVGSIPPKEVPVTAPKTDLAKLFEGFGTALKPAYEPILLARKPLEGTVADNVTKWGTGALDIDSCRVARADNDTAYGWSITGSKASDNLSMSGANYERSPEFKPGDTMPARWPANLILDEEAAQQLDASTKPSRSNPYRENQATGDVLPFKRRTSGGYNDSGGPSRFFYSSKVSTKERNYGCSDPNKHPTLKPISLTTYLAQLILPPPNSDRRIIVPYCGTGSEIIGALFAGFDEVIGIDNDRSYLATARERIDSWT